MTLIGFSADWHVDEYGRRLDPETGLNLRLLDYLRTAAFVATEAKRQGAEALVVAGDLTEAYHPRPWLVDRIADALAAGPDRVILGRGNHDGERAGRSIVDVLGRHPGWTGAGRPAIHFVQQVAVVVLPYVDRHWLRAQPGFETVPDSDLFRVLGEQFLTIARGQYVLAKKRGAKATVLVCHQGLSGGAMSESQAAVLGSNSLVVDSVQLGAIGYEAVVAGHFHRHQVLGLLGGPVLYTGSIERVDFGEQDETKGFVVADVGPGRFDWQFVETPARHYVTLDDATIADALGVEGAIVRARFTDPDVDVDDVRRFLHERGAFDVGEVTAGRRAAPDLPGGLAETVVPTQALEAFFEGDPDWDALVELGRATLAEAA